MTDWAAIVVFCAALASCSIMTAGSNIGSGLKNMKITINIVKEKPHDE